MQSLLELIDGVLIDALLVEQLSPLRVLPQQTRAHLP